MAGTPERIHVLLVEDSEDDYLVTRARLAEVGVGRFEVDWASTYDQAMEKMGRHEHDVYLVDYYLGPRTGLELLRAALTSGIKVPIIMLTGSGAQEIDLKAMKSGAADYLVKDELTAPLLERSIRYALEHARSRAELEKSRDDMLSIMEQLRLGTAMTDREGRITFLNEVCERLLGKSRQEAMGTPWAELWPFRKEDRVALKEMLERPQSERGRVAVELEGPRGRHYWLEIEVGDDPREPERKIFFLYDVTEVKDLRRLLNEKSQFQELVGKSTEMGRVFDQIRELADFDSTVLIEGETGTGKELVAKAIHATSRRKDRPFIAVNCAGLTESLLGSQLFGHKRGAFTGAVDDHRGLFETANGGTIFLDEIGDIPTSVQTSLLRVLQEREITRVGESLPRKIDIRVVAATHHDLKADVQKGTMRLDLMYRIRVVRILLPPLRERREDIPLLATAFLARFRAATGRPIQDLSNEALDALMRYSWPGNIRELLSAIEFAVIRCKGPAIQLDQLPLEVVGIEKTPTFLGQRLEEESERRRVLAALEWAKGNRTAAAKVLGMSRATFYRRLGDLGLSGKPEAEPAATLPLPDVVAVRE